MSSKLGPLKLETGTPTLLYILLLYPFNVDVNIIIQNPLCHQDVTKHTPMTSWFVLVGMFAHVPGQLSGNSCSEQRG